MMENDGPRGRDAVIVAAVVSGSTTAQAAEIVDCSEATVTRARRTWRPHIEAEQAARATATAAQLMDRVPAAVQRMGELIDSPNDSVALGACRTVLDFAKQWRDVAVSAYAADTFQPPLDLEALERQRQHDRELFDMLSL